MISDDEKKIIGALRRNARVSLKKLAEEVNMPSSTVHFKVKRFEGNVISRHTALVDFRQLGYLTHLFIVLKTRRDQREALESFLLNSKNTNTVYQVNDNFDFLVEAIFKNPKEAQDFLDELKSNFEIEHSIHNIINIVKKEEFI